MSSAAYRALLGSGWARAVAAFAVWMIYFTVVYAVHSVGCVLGWADTRIMGFNALTVWLAVITLATVLAIALLGRAQYRPNATVPDSMQDRERFGAVVAWLACGLALIATLWVGLPVLMVAPCQ
jgi:hypothetical protein